MRRNTALVLLAGMTAAALAAPRAATAQVSVGVRFYWAWSDGGWQAHRYDWDGRRGAFYLGVGAMAVPAAYMPPAGYCREWIPGLPVWRQPPPVPCEWLFRPYGYARAGVVILGGAGFRGPVYRGERDGWRERYDGDDRVWGYDGYHRAQRYDRGDRDDRVERYDRGQQERRPGRDDRADRTPRSGRDGRTESLGRANRDSRSEVRGRVVAVDAGRAPHRAVTVERGRAAVNDHGNSRGKAHRRGGG